MLVFILYSLWGLKAERDNEQTQWCYDVLLETGFDPPEIHVLRGEIKKSCIKIKNGVAFIYLKEDTPENEKKTLGHLLTFITSDIYKDDAQYYTNLDVVMDHIEDKFGVKRLPVVV